MCAGRSRPGQVEQDPAPGKAARLRLSLKRLELGLRSWSRGCVPREQPTYVLFAGGRVQ